MVCSDKLGSPKWFATALVLIILWALSGPLFHYSTTWQLIINTSTTIFTFLAVFLLQHAQNANTRAIHLKLDEIIYNNEQLSNEFIHVEQDDEEVLEELDKLHKGMV
jgi:low affinity Fe/Cu permease